jgi:hypothetical protein
VAGDVAGELLRVELARSDDQVVDRLLGLDPEHDRGVAELEVEVEQERLLALVLRSRRRRVRGDARLPRPAFRREDGDDPAPATPAGLRLPARTSRLADREDDVLGHLREEEHVGRVGL